MIEKSSIKSEKEMQRVRREVAIQSALRHPHIVKIMEGQSLAITGIRYNAPAPRVFRKVDRYLKVCTTLEGG